MDADAVEMNVKEGIQNSNLYTSGVQILHSNQRKEVQEYAIIFISLHFSFCIFGRIFDER